MDKLKRVLSGSDTANSDGSGIIERANEATTLSCGTRVKGFFFCSLLGVVCSVVGTSLLWIPRFGLAAFAILYSIGNICSMGSIMFLAGPCRQIRSMCAPERAIAVSVMMVCLALTLCAAFWWKNNGLALLFCILQALAFTWYGLSYVPFIRDGIIKLCTFCL
ncbi:vesicle transport protein SFT2B-like isoform X3 [Synchiropus splendidus]|uniref:vesicle transport protein SFT2B-like isoform X3 n=1 Tax=Synchiropus splendidus TaxID=270530 RepID=UPI00237DE178|nr:vesicle transport protein SFT2B-like isoform X3 [Synchiropus splendidus]